MISFARKFWSDWSPFKDDLLIAKTYSEEKQNTHSAKIEFEPMLITVGLSAHPLRHYASSPFLLFCLN